MAAGATDLINEAATSKITGEEERYSRTDLVDFDANMKASMKVAGLLSPYLRTVDPDRLAPKSGRMTHRPAMNLVSLRHPCPQTNDGRRCWFFTRNDRRLRLIAFQTFESLFANAPFATSRENQLIPYAASVNRFDRKYLVRLHLLHTADESLSLFPCIEHHSVIKLTCTNLIASPHRFVHCFASCMSIEFKVL